MMRALTILALSVVGCGQAATEARSAPPAIPISAEEALAAPADHDARARVRFALAQHFEQAELREGGALFADLGTPGGAKYTSGGWSTQIGPDREIEGTSAALTIG